MGNLFRGGINFSNNGAPIFVVKNVDENIIKKVSKEARDSILTQLEDQYIDLNMEIDACQGCMEGLDEAFDELLIYKELIKFLGGNIERNYKKVLDRWYARRKEEERLEQEEKEREPFDSISIPMMDLILSDNTKDKLLLDLAMNYNALVAKLNEFYKNQNK